VSAQSLPPPVVPPPSATVPTAAVASRSTLSLSPNQRAWARFKRNRLGLFSLIIFSAMLAIATLAELVSNDRPLIAHYNGKTYFPLFNNQPESVFGGDFQTALNSFNNAALAVPNSALAFYGLGNAYLASRKPPEAARAYQQALKIRPNMALALKGMGDALYSQGKSKESIDYYARALALGYDSPSLKLAMARSLNKERRSQEALNLAAELSKSNPSTEVFLTLGDAYAGLKQNREAYGAYRQAAEMDSRSALAQYKLGEVSFQLRDYVAARDAFGRALALDPEGKTFDASRARDLQGKSAAKLGEK